MERLCLSFSFSSGNPWWAESTLPRPEAGLSGVHTRSFDFDFTCSCGDRFHASFLLFPMRHTIECVAQPERPNKYLLVSIMEGTLMVARCVHPAMLPLTGGINVVLPQHLWKISWHCLSHAPYLSFPCSCSFQSSSFPRKGITLSPNKHADRGGN